VFVYGLGLIRVSGRRTFGKWSALDVIVSVTAGSALSRALTGNAALGGTLAAVTVLIALHWLMAHGVARSRALSCIAEGRPVVLGCGGTLDERARLRHAVSLADIEEALHRRGLDELPQKGRVTLEPNGTINAVDP
jgi:uncharacterized membrane protein YcaP (DUF421 family)